jgi:hypothetical protein
MLSKSAKAEKAQKASKLQLKIIRARAMIL